MPHATPLLGRRRAGLAAAAVAAALALAAAVHPLAAQDADTPVDRLLQKVEALLSSVKASGDADPALVRQLEAIAKDAREAKAAAAATPPAGGNGGGAPTGGGPPGAGGFAAQGARWLVDRVLRDVELNDRDRKAVEELLLTFGDDYTLARTHRDDRSRQLLRQDVEDRIDRTVPRKEAGKIKNELNAQLRWLDWGGRR